MHLVTTIIKLNDVCQLIVIYFHVFLVLADVTVNESKSDEFPVASDQTNAKEPPNLNNEPTKDESTNKTKESEKMEPPNGNNEEKEHIEALPFPIIAPGNNLKVNSNNCNSNRSPGGHFPKPRTPTSISAHVQYSSDVEGFVGMTVNKSEKDSAADGATTDNVQSRRIGVDPVTPKSNRKIMSPGNSMTPIIGHNKVMPLSANPVSTKLPPIASNKVSPLPPMGTEIPPENRVVCTVDIHREKTPSIASTITSPTSSPVN